MGFLGRAKYSCLIGDVLKLRRDDYFEPATPLALSIILQLLERKSGSLPVILEPSVVLVSLQF